MQWNFILCWNCSLQLHHGVYSTEIFSLDLKPTRHDKFMFFYSSMLQKLHSCKSKCVSYFSNIFMPTLRLQSPVSLINERVLQISDISFLYQSSPERVFAWRIAEVAVYPWQWAVTEGSLSICFIVTGICLPRNSSPLKGNVINFSVDTNPDQVLARKLILAWHYKYALGWNKS